MKGRKRREEKNNLLYILLFWILFDVIIYLKHVSLFLKEINVNNKVIAFCVDSDWRASCHIPSIQIKTKKDCSKRCCYRANRHTYAL